MRIWLKNVSVKKDEKWKIEVQDKKVRKNRSIKNERKTGKMCCGGGGSIEDEKRWMDDQERSEVIYPPKKVWLLVTVKTGHWP